MGRLSRSFGHALRGLKYILRYEPNARIHLLLAIIALVMSAALQVGTIQTLLIGVVIILVFLAEIINSAIEKTLDIVEPNHHPQVKVIKDMSAGGVLVTAILAVVVGVVIFTLKGIQIWHG